MVYPLLGRGGLSGSPHERESTANAIRRTATSTKLPCFSPSSQRFSRSKLAPELYTAMDGEGSGTWPVLIAIHPFQLKQTSKDMINRFEFMHQAAEEQHQRIPKLSTNNRPSPSRQQKQQKQQKQQPPQQPPQPQPQKPHDPHLDFGVG